MEIDYLWLYGFQRFHYSKRSSPSLFTPSYILYPPPPRPLSKHPVVFLCISPAPLHRIGVIMMCTHLSN